MIAQNTRAAVADCAVHLVSRCGKRGDMATRTLYDLGIDADAVEEALSRDMTFPARWYSDPDIYAFELEHIFTRSWQYAGSLDKLRRPGDHIVCRVGHVPLVVTLDRDGELHAFVNVCRHRAFPVAVEDGNRSTLQCGYHAWTYNLDGSLRAADTGCDAGVVVIAKHPVRPCSRG